MMDGTQGYAQEAEALIRQYESVAFTNVHRRILHLIPAAPADILDIGAGTGRDAAGFAVLGHRVTAVEPTRELREAARILHGSPAIEWLDDGLPELPTLSGRRGCFDLIMLSAVWMHLDEQQRRRAMPVVCALSRPGGVMILTLRHGPVPAGRRMFDVSANETEGLASAEGLTLILHLDGQDGLFGRSDVSWTRLAFRKTGCAEVRSPRQTTIVQG